ENRTAAGRALGSAVAASLEQRISGYADVYIPLVLALPRGGVPVGYEVAKALNADFDLVITQKIGLPWQTSFGVGAIAEDGPPVRRISSTPRRCARPSATTGWPRKRTP